MSDVYLIEVEGRSVGLVARDRDARGYRFHAALQEFYTIDSQLFRTPDEARLAARKIVEGRHGTVRKAA